MATVPNVTAKPSMIVGDVLAKGYQFETIPTGIAIDPRETKTLELSVSHAAATVPFPGSDLDNARVSALTLEPGSGKPPDSRRVIQNRAKFVHFCSSRMAEATEAFVSPLFFTNRAASKTANGSGMVWPPSASSDLEGPSLMVARDPAADLGRWESSATLDPPTHFGQGALPVEVQGPMISIEDSAGPEIDPTTCPFQAGSWTASTASSSKGLRR